MKALLEMINTSTDMTFHAAAEIVQKHIVEGTDPSQNGVLMTALALRAHAILAEQRGEQGRLSRWVLAVLDTEPPQDAAA